jgi:CheY-like chemotaxis protein
MTEREVPQMLAEALEGAERVQRIVEDLRVFSQPRHQVATSVDVVQVIESCVRMTAGEVRHRARVVRTFEDVPPVRAAEARVAQVITNLLLNAAQAMPDGEADRHAITIVARAVGDVVEIRVEDDGLGIAPEHLPHVFEPFFTTKTERGGTGLGLSICRMLVSSQGGTLDLESERGRGTRVTLKLPCASAFDSPAPLRGEVAPLAAAKRVLVVDDEARVAELLRDNLSPHQVTIVTSGRDALTAIATSPPFDAIVCDLMMPELWGADVHGQIRALHPGMERRLVFMTGGAFTPTAAEFLASVPNECLRKPFAIERLLEAIEHAAHVT